MTTQAETKHDVFVGNLSYNTTAESLQEIFNKVGTVANVRIVTDRDTGRPRGFAFIEYDDAATALSAIRNLDGYDLNGRKLRVSYSNNSNLKDMARQMGQVVQDSYQSGNGSGKDTEEVVASLKLHEAYDILEAMKRIVDEDSGERARTILEAHPQLVFALLQIQKRLGMAISQSALLSANIPNSTENDSMTIQDGTPSTNIAPVANPHQQHLIQQLLSMTEDDLKNLPVEQRQIMYQLREQMLSLNSSG
mmetsp:Transcript_8838/g.9353  ORF Transcript_8838/g.9353 Transcript_8838/m.9353 type:complete len:250 (+) Transcript_8838:33-782(+)